MVNYLVTKGNSFDDEKENWYIEYTPVASIKMNKRPLKIEFTPSKVSKKNFLVVFHRLFPYLSNIAISTFHLAYDFERDLSALRVNWPKVMYRPIYNGHENLKLWILVLLKVITFNRL